MLIELGYQPLRSLLAQSLSEYPELEEHPLLSYISSGLLTHDGVFEVFSDRKE